MRLHIQHSPEVMHGWYVRIEMISFMCSSTWMFNENSGAWQIVYRIYIRDDKIVYELTMDCQNALLYDMLCVMRVFVCICVLSWTSLCSSMSVPTLSLSLSLHHVVVIWLPPVRVVCVCCFIGMISCVLMLCYWYDVSWYVLIWCGHGMWYNMKWYMCLVSHIVLFMYICV